MIVALAVEDDEDLAPTVQPEDLREVEEARTSLKC